MAATETLEIERTYDLDEPFELPPDGLPGAPVVDGPRQDELDAAYFDTSDLRLHRGGVTLRRRTGGPDEGWHLKLPGGAAGERIELRLPLGKGAAVPDELVELTLSRTRGAPLAQVARLRTDRRRWRLSGGDGELAEVVSDTVHAELTGDRAGEPTRWHELEVELLGGEREVLDRWDARLRELGARPASSSSKVGRVLAGMAPTRSAPAPDPSSAGAAVLAYLRDQLDAIVANDPAVRRGGAEPVHDMRVAARRARATLQSFRRILDRERTEPVVEELRWLGTVLAGAREARVQHARQLERLRELPPELVPGSAASWADSRLSAEHGRALAGTRAELRGPRYLALLDALHALLDAPPLAGAAAEPATDVLPALVKRAQRRVRRAHKRYLRAGEETKDAAGSSGEEVQDAAGAGKDGRDVALHDMRKAAKRARYAAEVAAPALGKPADRSVKRLKAVQGALGDHQDTVVSRDVLRRLAADAPPASAFAYGVLAGLDLAEAERLRASLPKLWRRADRRKIRRWMG